MLDPHRGLRSFCLRIFRLSTTCRPVLAASPCSHSAWSGAKMSDFGLAAYRGEANIPHLPEQHFTCYFAGAQLALLMLLSPGRFFGSELSARRFNRDYIWSVCEQNARRREVRRGKKPTYALFKPIDTDHSILKKWHRQIHWKSWTRERMGGGWIRSV